MATSPHDFKLLLDAEGRRGTTMADAEVSGAPTERWPSSAVTRPLTRAGHGRSSGCFSW